MTATLTHSRLRAMLFLAFAAAFFTASVALAVTVLHNDDPTVHDPRCTESFRRVVADAKSMNPAYLHQITTPDYTCSYR